MGSRTASAKWFIIAVLAAIDGVGLYHRSIHLGFSGVLKVSIAPLLLMGLAICYSRWRPDQHLAHLAETSALCMVFYTALGAFSYLAAATNFPLADDVLDHADRMLGFDWPSWFTWVYHHPIIRVVLFLAYDSATPQMGIIILYLGLTGQHERNSEFLWTMMLSALFTVPIFALVPAASAWVHYGMANAVNAIHMPDLIALRSGQMHEIDLARMQGLVTFPSFHTTLAVLFAYALRGRPFLFAFGLLLNGLMIISVPSEGGHYLIDVIAGIVMAVAAIWAATRVEALLGPKVAGAMGGDGKNQIPAGAPVYRWPSEAPDDLSVRS